VGILAQRGGAGVTLGRGGGEQLLIISHINIVRSHLEHVCLNTTVSMFQFINFKLFLYHLELRCFNFNFEVVCVNQHLEVGSQQKMHVRGVENLF
jgi:hypothetical protein